MLTDFGIKFGLDADLWIPVDPKNCTQFESSSLECESTWRDAVATSSRAVSLITAFFYNFHPSDQVKFEFDSECFHLANQHGICLLDYHADVPVLERRLKHTFGPPPYPRADGANPWRDRLAFIKKYTRTCDYERMLAVATEAAEHRKSTLNVEFPLVHAFLLELSSS